MTGTHRLTLGNGLRVLLAPSAGAAVAVAVHYDVGFRSESEGRGGFAHLFEHLMFQGSAHHPKLEHWDYVQGLGGTVNGSTHQDYTDYYQLLPAAGLERVLELEADRMARLRITEETFDNQRAVVKEEIRLNIDNRPYGGFPWIPLPALLYRSHANSHNGYGALEDLDAATAEDAAAFYRTHYVPANAVLTVAGDIDPEAAAALVDRHFGPLPARPAPARVPLDEPPRTSGVRGEHHDAHAPLPALALGHRLPDPRTDAYLARMVLCELLTGGPAAPLPARLVRDSGVAVRVTAGCGLFDSLDARTPDTLALVVTHHRGTGSEAVLAEVDAELERLAGAPGALPGVNLARQRLAARITRRDADLLARARTLGAYELLHGRAALVDELPARVGAVTDDAVREALRALLSEPRAELFLVPGRQPNDTTHRHRELEKAATA